MTKKKKKEYHWIDVDSSDDALIEDYDPVHEYVKHSINALQSNIPQKMRIKPGDPGFIFGVEQGVFNGSLIGIPLGEEWNCAIMGANGSGKSFYVIMRSLLNYGGDIIATDIKGELSEFYKKYAKPGINKPCIVFDPTDPETVCYDPFDKIDGDDEAELVQSIREIALIIVPETKEINDTVWDDAERSVLTAGLIYFYKLGLSFSEALIMISTLSITELCARIIKSDDALLKSFLGEIGMLKSTTRANVDFGLRGKLTKLTNDPQLMHAFRGGREGAKSFSWDDLEKYNIFIRVPNDKIEQWGKFINIIYTQLIHHLSRRPEKYSKEGSKVEPALVVMDEFARFGKLDAIIPAISTLRSKKVNICIVLQSLAQLDMIYGAETRRVLLDNCQYQVILGANDAETQRILSDRIGTIKRLQESISHQYDDCMDETGYSEQVGNVREPNVFPHELATMKDIILLTPDGYFRVDKVPPSGATNGEEKPVETEYDVPIIEAYALPYDYNTDGIVVHGEPILTPQKVEIVQDIAEVKNEGAKMLTFNERSKNADKKAGIAEYQRMVAQLGEEQSDEEIDTWQNSVIGYTLLKHFPELAEIAINDSADGRALSINDIERAFKILADDEELIDNLKVKTGLDFLDAETL